MRPEYGNWVPRKLKRQMLCATILLAAPAVLCGAFMPPGTTRVVLLAILIVTCAACAMFAQWCFMAYRGFSYDGDIRLSQRIVQGTASFVRVPDGGTCLDVGRGSGALAIAERVTATWAPSCNGSRPWATRRSGSSTRPTAPS